jgi:SPP1 gp7 family putative phage head morphogenesis protein
MSTPEALYRNAIDLNRYSNSVAKRLVVSYNDIIIDAVNQLRGIDDLAAPVKAARLRAILAQLKESLGTWSDASVATMADELQGLALLQSEFVEDQLRRALPAGARSAVNTVEISPQFAQSVVTTDPTQINVVALSDDLFAAVQGAPQTFSLTAAQGATITLPNGQVVSKAFRGIAVDQAERFSQVVRQGLLTGEPTQDIAKRLIGNLDRSEERLIFGEVATTRGQLRAAGIKNIIASGGDLTAMADNQIVTLVRTSVNQVANAAAMSVYEANQDVTKEYRYVATLDTQTSAICRALDGQQFTYGKGPTPPQHFGCRSKVVAVVDPDILPPSTTATRASQAGQVPVNQTYGEWLANQDLETKAKALGARKVAYFEKLSEKYGPKKAIAKLVRDDGSELTLEQLKARYGPA